MRGPQNDAMETVGLQALRIEAITLVDTDGTGAET